MTKENADAAELSAMPFEKAMAELERIVGELEKGSVSLDDSVRLYARGKALQDRCEKLLAEAESRVEKITLGENGAPKGVAPLDVE
ncbi:MAG: exodeoxyribonuclease VII small subunit [Hyphomicrobiales bacterium]